jgi:hypothetical protein
MQLPQLGSQECKVHRSHSRYAAVHNATRAIVVELSSGDPTNHFRSRLNRIPSMTDFDPHLPVAIFWSTVGYPCRVPFDEFRRKPEFGESSHCRISTSDVSKFASDRPLSKMR